MSNVNIYYKTNHVKIVKESGDMYQVIPFFAIASYEYVNIKNHAYLTLHLTNKSTVSLEDKDRQFVKSYMRWLNNSDRDPNSWKKDYFANDPQVEWCEED